MKKSIIEYEEFFKRYKEFKVKSEKVRVKEFIATGNRFFQNLKKVKEEYEKNVETNAFDFNVFSILKFQRPEEALHSPIITELLNVNGKHGQKDLFYVEFLRTLCPTDEFIFNLTNSDLNEYSISNEAFIKTRRGRSGRIDIEIQSLNPKNKFVVIIENKWNSPDSGFDQIAKYYQAKIQKGFQDSKIILVYLSKKGGEPDRKYISYEFQEILDAKKGETYFPIKYSVEIKEWLRMSSEKTKADRVKDLIYQYINIL